ncbi:MAG: hypothetical protein IKN07_03200 [Lachnospiraceae bacterium]|nr:hypothetical protein [Lachnospiraceae bacterium]MBR3734860.1 hypothetical protein [Lachnospiraceae bacterium]
MRKRWVAILLTAVMLGSEMSVYAAEEDTEDVEIVEEEEFSDLLEEKFEEEQEEEEEVEYEDVTIEEDAEIPEETEDIDLYESSRFPAAYPAAYKDDWLFYMQKNYPATRDQAPFGTCYAHAAIASAELWALKNGIADTSVDYSEAHLGYWMCHELPIGPADGKDRLVNGYKEMTGGGVLPNIVNTLSHGVGPVPESVVPYSRYGELSNGAELDDATALQHEFRLVGVKELNDMDEIKDCILQNGSVNVSMNYNAWYGNPDRNNAYYYTENPDYQSTNHMLVIVGWDNNYPKENFQARYNGFENRWMGGTPEHNGAWLARNSSSTEVFEGAASYFWISYESKQMYFRSMEYSDDLTYDREYTYNQVGDVMGGAPTGKIFANQYVADSNCRLGAVSFLTGSYTEASDYEMDIFVSEEEISIEDPQSLAYHTSGHIYDGFGYYRLDIDPVYLCEGDHFLIRFSFPKEGAYILAESDSSGADGYQVQPGSAPNRSYLQWRGAWVDVGAVRKYDMLISAFTDEYVVSSQPENESIVEDPEPKVIEESKEVIEPKEETPEPEPEKYTGLCLQNGKWVYMTDDRIDMTKYGFVTYNNNRFLIANGTVAPVNGLAMDPDSGIWYFCSFGQICNYSGLAMYDNEWFYVENGRLDTDFSGLIPYNGSLFYIAAGRIVREANGLVMDPKTGEWYFCSCGQVQTQYSGEVVYNGEIFFVENGRLI